MTDAVGVLKRMTAALRGRFRPTPPSKTVGYEHGVPLSAAEKEALRREADRVAAFIEAQMAAYQVKVRK